MDFQDSPEEAAFRARVRSFLAARAPQWELPKTPLSEDERLRYAKGWQAQKCDAGFTGITWKKEFGGQGGTPLQQLVYAQEEQAYRVFTLPFAVGLGMCIPTMYTYTPPEIAQRFVKPAMRGEEIWCQLFSEPAAGSDLAGARMRAVKDGDEWVLNGQKVWTSYAHLADFAIVVTRTDPTVAKHAGLTMFYLSMKQPGIEVRRIRSIPGDAEFNEVFFTDVRVPDSQRLGPVNGGWKVALTTLMHERLSIGRSPDAPSAAELAKLARSIPDGDGTRLDDGAVRDAIARTYVADAGMDFIRMRLQTALSKGQTPGPEASIGKLVTAKTRQDVGRLAMDLLESGAIEESDDPRIDRFRFHYLWSAGLRIAGGTDEILRNIIAERVLGLPGDVRQDKDVPFNQLK
ncbi:MAG TPA: acyl-CoA dehydrogenase family protein [Nevskiaceae bacterium]|nr:acyl-CoA dehydrogenase family protein [Nevskiaceae bacterium]